MVGFHFFIVNKINRVTLFDSPEDDEFDGDLGEDDEETPKILLKFSLETIEKNPKVNVGSTVGKETLKKAEMVSSSNKNREISPRKPSAREEKKSGENLQANSSPIKDGKGLSKSVWLGNNDLLLVEEKGLESKIDSLINVLETQRSIHQNSSRKELVSTENNNK